MKRCMDAILDGSRHKKISATYLKAIANRAKSAKELCR